MAPTVSGTIAAALPMLVPTTIRVNGMIATIRIKNGSERPTLTTTPSTALSGGAGSRPPRSVTTSSTPSSSPKAAVSSVATPVM
ncbi:hypothetical protein [Actinomadura welshii]|uniref:hypothetical protein n=1 Tax=Actinomadura welshii TaxID=3103817 RepID=UPI0003AD38B7|nr:hypothetical protein [Actinomadura madurae]